MKIAIMGDVGSGKSVLARNLSKMLGIPKLELDDIAFDLNWKAVDRKKILPDIQKLMEQDSWIIDGNYDDLLQTQRLEMADRIIFVMLPRVQCLFRALRRTKERKAAGYQNDINPWFLRYLLFGCRNKERRKRYQCIMRQYPEKIVVLRSQSAIDDFLACFSIESAWHT